MTEEVVFLDTREQMFLSDLQRLELLRYMDDDFMTVCLADNLEGVELMCKLLEDMKYEAAQESARETARETAERLIKKGKMSLEDIADCVPILSFEELKKLESKIMQLA